MLLNLGGKSYTVGPQILPQYFGNYQNLGLHYIFEKHVTKHVQEVPGNKETPKGRSAKESKQMLTVGCRKSWEKSLRINHEFGLKRNC